jgi:hypothetical protein
MLFDNASANYSSNVTPMFSSGFATAACQLVAFAPHSDFGPMTKNRDSWNPFAGFLRLEGPPLHAARDE